MKTSIRLLRHGICEGGNIFRGHWDSPLSSEGHQQMLAACAELQDIDVIISSPLQRCRQVAEELAQQYSNSDLLIEEGFKEINFGDWEGADIDALMESQQSQLEAFWSDPVSNSPPNGETMVDFNRRVCHAWHSILQQYQHKQILLISHGGVIRCILADVLGMSLRPLSRISVPHACLSQIDIFHEAGKPDWPQLIHHGLN